MAEGIYSDYVSIGVPADFGKSANTGFIQNVAVFGYVDAVHSENPSSGSEEFDAA